MLENFESAAGVREAALPEQLSDFRQEIAALKRGEEEKYRRGTGTSGHFSAMDPEKLTEEDMDVWQKFQISDLTEEEFNEYRSHVFGDSREFAAYLGNMLVVRNLTKQHEERKRKAA